MDSSRRTEALRLAKQCISTHGMVNYMNKYNRDLLSRPVEDGTTGLRYEFHMDPLVTTWSVSNPSCTLLVTYSPSHAGTRMNEAGDAIVDHLLRVAVSTSATDMDVAMLLRRENMVASLGMLCELLQASVPPLVEVCTETAAEREARRAADHEQVTSSRIMDHVGHDTLKGLVSGGRPRLATLGDSYVTSFGSYPECGRYRFKKVMTTDRRGRPRDVRHYVIDVTSRHEGRTIGVRRIKEK